MNKFLGLDYESHPKAMIEIQKLILEKLDTIVHKNEVSKDWIDLLIALTSSSFDGDRNAAKAEISDLLGVN